MRIFLVGFMGCGKTTAGRKLAVRLNVPFVDLDHLFEAQTHTTVPWYFEQYGETAFREKEKELLQSAAYPADAVVATGGGAPCFFDNMEWMNANGLTVYLHLSPAMLASRLEHAAEVRPVLQNHRGRELVEFIAAKLAERAPFYEMAHLTADGKDLTADALAQLIETYQRR